MDYWVFGIAVFLLMGALVMGQDDISFIKIPLGYIENPRVHNNNFFNFTFIGDSGINRILSANIYFDILTTVKQTPQRFNITINNSQCSNQYIIQGYGGQNIPIRLQPFYSCGTQITKAGFYLVNLSSNNTFNNTYGWVEITYLNGFFGNLTQNFTNIQNSINTLRQNVKDNFTVIDTNLNNNWTVTNALIRMVDNGQRNNQSYFDTNLNNNFTNINVSIQQNTTTVATNNYWGLFNHITINVTQKLDVMMGTIGGWIVGNNSIIVSQINQLKQSLSNFFQFYMGERLN